MGTLSSNATVPAALVRLTSAHSRLIRTNSWRTFGRLKNEGGNGTKSCASFSASGQPRGTESKNAPPNSAVPREGCKKYTNRLLELTSATTERAVRPTVPSRSRPGRRSRRHSRRRRAMKFQAKAVQMAPFGPSTERAA